jgi:cytochrome c peroxidase
MMWDERAATLEHQVLMPIQDSVEMGFNLTDLTKRLSEKPYYPPLFQKAFGTPEITSDRISKALAQFVRSIVTYQSKYDSVKMGLQSFTQKEAEGEQLFINNCAGCHQPPMFLTSNPVAPFGIRDPNDGGINNEGRFKVGSLRNVFEAASLFHNGSANDPYTVLQHDDGVHKLPVLEATSVRFFLQTLTDNNVRSNKMFSDPFRVR